MERRHGLRVAVREVHRIAGRRVHGAHLHVLHVHGHWHHASHWHHRRRRAGCHPVWAHTAVMAALTTTLVSVTRPILAIIGGRHAISPH